MNPENQKEYGPGIHPPYQLDPHPPPQNDVRESDEQRNFAAECLKRGWRNVWHATHKRSTANRGCPDFIVAAFGRTYWIEFKRAGQDLAPDQEAFQKQLAQNGVTMYVVFSAYEATQVIENNALYDII